MNKIERRIEWKTASGKQAEIIIALQISRTVDADGDRCEAPCCDLNFRASVLGMGTLGYRISREPVLVGGTLYPASIGKLVIPAVQLAEIDAVLADIYATPEWQAKEAGIEANKKADAKYDQHRAFMRKQMGY